MDKYLRLERNLPIPVKFFVPSNREAGATLLDIPNL